MPKSKPAPKTSRALTHIKHLTPDPVNARAHNARNIGLLTDALQEVGAARSIVIDEDGVILSGNGTVEAAAHAGITRLQVIDGDGNTIIAVRRKGLTAPQKARLALLDNRVAELATWDPDVLKQLQIDGVPVGDLWTDTELAVLFDAPAPEPTEETASQSESCGCPTCGAYHKPKS